MFPLYKKNIVLDKKALSYQMETCAHGNIEYKYTFPKY